jgi:hypothetical protein
VGLDRAQGEPLVTDLVVEAFHHRGLVDGRQPPELDRVAGVEAGVALAVEPGAGRGVPHQPLQPAALVGRQFLGGPAVVGDELAGRA